MPSETRFNPSSTVKVCVPPRTCQEGTQGAGGRHWRAVCWGRIMPREVVGDLLGKPRKPGRISLDRERRCRCENAVGEPIVDGSRLACCACRRFGACSVPLPGGVNESAEEGSAVSRGTLPRNLADRPSEWLFVPSESGRRKRDVRRLGKE